MMSEFKRDDRRGLIKSRRQFLKNSARASAITLVTPAMTRSAETSGEVVSAQAARRFELEEATIAGLQDGMKSGKYTARRLVEMYLARIDEVDRQGPRINSVIEVNPDALAIAESLDKERKARGPRGPLHGV